MEYEAVRHERLTAWRNGCRKKKDSALEGWGRRAFIKHLAISQTSQENTGFNCERENTVLSLKVTFHTL